MSRTTTAKMVGRQVVSWDVVGVVSKFTYTEEIKT
jgi:hypothetical protein